MKKSSLFSMAVLSACTICVTTPLKANAEVYYSTSVSRPSEGDTWFRNVGDGTDTLHYENGKWVLAMSDSVRRKNAYHQYVLDVYEPNAQEISEAQAKQNAYIDSAIKNPSLYQSLPDSETMSVYVMRVTNGQPFKGKVRIPKVTIPDQVPIKSASTFVSADIPVMLSVVSSGSSSESNNESSSSANSSSSSESGATSLSTQSTSSSLESDITNPSINDSEADIAHQIQSNGSSTATTNAAKTTTTSDAPAATKSVDMNASSNSSDTTKSISTKSPVANSTTTSNQSNNQTSSSASSMSKIKKNINNMLPQTDEAKSNVVTYGILTLLVSVIGFLSIFRYKDGSRI